MGFRSVMVKNQNHKRILITEDCTFIIMRDTLFVVYLENKTSKFLEEYIQTLT